MKTEIEEKIKRLLQKYNSTLVKFEYYPKAFGDIELIINVQGKELKFNTDRGDVFCNGQMICSHEYKRSEHKATWQVLLEVVELKLYFSK